MGMAPVCGLLVLRTRKSILLALVAEDVRASKIRSKNASRRHALTPAPRTHSTPQPARAQDKLCAGVPSGSLGPASRARPTTRFIAATYTCELWGARESESGEM